MLVHIQSKKYASPGCHLDALGNGSTWRVTASQQLGRLTRHTGREKECGHRLWNQSPTVLNTKQRHHEEPLQATAAVLEVVKP